MLISTIISIRSRKLEFSPTLLPSFTEFQLYFIIN